MALVARVLVLEVTVAAFLFALGRPPGPTLVLGRPRASCRHDVRGARILDPGLMEERMKPGPGGRDRRLRAWLSLCFLIQFVVAGLDVGRFGWSGRIPPAVQWTALLVYAGGMVLCLWAMAVNRFFSPVVRLQAGARAPPGDRRTLSLHPASRLCGDSPVGLRGDRPGLVVVAPAPRSRRSA